MDGDNQLYENHQRHLSNDSAVGVNEEITSPLQHSHCAKPSSCSSTGEFAHEVSNSVDSAFSNNSSHTSSVSSNEAVNGHDVVRVHSPPHYASASLPLHTRMSSGVSIQSDSLSPSSNSIILANSPKLPHKTALTSSKYSSMPVLDPQSDSPRNSLSLAYRQTPSPFSVSHKFRKSSSAGKEKKSKKRKKSGGSGGSSSVEDIMPEYNPRRSPILMKYSLRETAEHSLDTSPNQSLSNDHTPLSSFSSSAIINHRFHFTVDPSTELLIWTTVMCCVRVLTFCTMCVCVCCRLWQIQLSFLHWRILPIVFLFILLSKTTQLKHYCSFCLVVY